MNKAIHTALLTFLQLLLLTGLTGLFLKLISNMFYITLTSSVLASSAFFPPFFLSYIKAYRTKMTLTLNVKLLTVSLYLAFQAVFMKLDSFMGWFTLFEIGFYTLLGFYVGEKVYLKIKNKLPNYK